jgi:hypothetical protein
MANIMRGETSLVIAGQRRALALTLGALAELEDALGPDGLSDGRLSAGDALAVLAAGLAGAGTPIGRYELGRLIPAAELGHARQTAADLLAASFGGGSPSRPPPPQAAA